MWAQASEGGIDGSEVRDIKLAFFSAACDVDDAREGSCFGCGGEMGEKLLNNADSCVC